MKTRKAMAASEGESVLELWELLGPGHAWSGGSPAGSNTSPAGPSALDERRGPTSAARDSENGALG